MKNRKLTKMQLRIAGLTLAAVLAGTPALTTVPTFAATNALVTASTTTVAGDVPTTTAATIDTTKKGSLSISKEIENNGDVHDGNYLDEAGEDSAIKVSGIKFNVTKVADLIQQASTDSTGTVTTGIYYRVTNNSANATLGLTAGKLYTSSELIKVMEDKIPTQAHALRTACANATTNVTTGADGSAKASNLDLGLYLVTEDESSLANAKNAATGKAVTIDTPDLPYLVAMPSTNIADITDANGTVHKAGTVWQYDIKSYPKNTDTVVVKKIVSGDPYETADKKDNLQNAKDEQVGDEIEQVITADIAALKDDKDTNTKFVLSDTMSKGMSLSTNYKGSTKGVVRVCYGPQTTVLADQKDNTAKKSDFKNFTDFAAEDYTVSDVTKNADGTSTFHVTLTASGLKKLDNYRLADGSKTAETVAVFFQSTLNKDAVIGPEGNHNKPTLIHSNVSTPENDTREVPGNEVFHYTYELDLLKTGLDDASVVTFNVKDKTASATANTKFVQDSAGNYHVYNPEQDTTATPTDAIHPAKDGKLYIKGLDSHVYTFTEVATKKGFNLLKNSFDINFVASTDANGLPTGTLKQYTEKDTNGSTITSGETKVAMKIDSTNKGKASATIQNTPTLTLHTGGAGVAGFYVAGAAALAAAGIAVVSVKRRKKEA